MNSTIEAILNNCRQKIQYLTSSDLRAEALLKLLQVEYSNLKNPNLLQSAKIGLVEMIEATNKSELLQDLEFAIQILTKYNVSKSFDNIIPFNRYSKDLADRFVTIRDIIKEIINNNNINSVFI